MGMMLRRNNRNAEIKQTVNGKEIISQPKNKRLDSLPNYEKKQEQNIKIDDIKLY